MSITQNSPYREMTFAGITFGVILGCIMTMAFTYSGLKLGFTLAGSEIAAILGFVFLHYILRKGSIVENNIQQTIASGINIGSAGISFTLPALLLMGQSFNPYQMTLAAIAGSFLGLFVIIPLRKQMIDLDRLRFPSGLAVATILKSPGAGVVKAKLLGIGTAVSMLAVIFTKLGVIPAEIPIGKFIGLPDYMSTSVALSLMNIGAGLLAGKGGLPFVAGGILGYWFIAPMAVSNSWIPTDITSEGIGQFIYGDMLRPMGIGILIGGAIMGVIMSFPAMRSAIGSIIRASANIGKNQTRDEMPPKLIGFGAIVSIVCLFIMAKLMGGDSVSIPMALAVSVVGSIWLALAGIIVAQCTGMTDISPLSGLSLIAVTLMLALTGNQVIVAMIIGVAVCVATSQCSDMMQDLKTGFLVGGIPYRQQLVQVSVAWLGPIIGIATMFLLWHTTDGTPGFGPDSTACIKATSGCLSAPQAGALQSIIQSVLSGNVPLDKYIAGGVIGAVLSSYVVSGMGVLVGLAMYLPFPITLGYGVGCLLNMYLLKRKSSLWVEEKMVPLAAGLIVGEALTELTYSLLIITGVVSGA